MPQIGVFNLRGSKEAKPGLNSISTRIMEVLEKSESFPDPMFWVSEGPSRPKWGLTRLTPESLKSA